MIAVNSPLIEPPIIKARLCDMPHLVHWSRRLPIAMRFLYSAGNPWRKAMALTMLDKTNDRADKSAWPAAIAAEFERERTNNNPCVGNLLVSENERVRV